MTDELVVHLRGTDAPFGSREAIDHGLEVAVALLVLAVLGRVLAGDGILGDTAVVVAAAAAIVGRAQMDPPTAFGVGGVGGSFAFGDTATGIAFALTKNRLTQDFNASAEIARMVMDSLPA